MILAAICHFASTTLGVCHVEAWRRGVGGSFHPSVHLGRGDLSSLLDQWGFRSVGTWSAIGQVPSSPGGDPALVPPLWTVLCGTPPLGRCGPAEARRSPALLCAACPTPPPPDPLPLPPLPPSACPLPTCRSSIAPLSTPPSSPTHTTPPPPQYPFPPIFLLFAHHGLHWRRGCPSLGPRRPRVGVHVALRLCGRPGGCQGGGPRGRCADHEVSFFDGRRWFCVLGRRVCESGLPAAPSRPSPSSVSRALF